MKKFNVLLLLPFILLSSCGEKNRVANLFIYDNTDPFMISLVSSFKEHFEKNDFELKTYSASRKQSLQNSQIVSVLEKNKGNPLLVNIVDRLSTSVLIEKAKIEDTPLLLFNREPLLEDTSSSDWAKENVYYVGADSKYQGQAQAEIAAQYFNFASSFKGSKFDKNGDGKLQVALFRGELSHQDAEARTKYCLDGLRKFGFDIDLVEVAFCDWEYDKGYIEMRKIVSRNTNIELLLSNNDAMALGAISYLKEIMKPDQYFLEQYFPIIGVDGTEDAIKAINDGYLIGSVLNDGDTQAQIIYDLYVSMIDNIKMPTLKDNVNQNGNFYYVKGQKITKNI